MKNKVKLILITALFPFFTISAQEFKWAIQPTYDDVLPFSEDLSCVKINGKWGYIDKTGKIKITPQFDYAFSFSEGLACIVVKNKVGYVDKTGKLIIAPQYDNTKSEILSGKTEPKIDTLIKKSTNGYEFLKNYNKYWEYIFWNFSEGLACVMKNNKFGYIDKTGKIIIPIELDEADAFHEGYAAVGKNKKFGYIDKSGKLIVSLIYKKTHHFSEGLAGVETIEGTSGYIDKTGKMVIPANLYNIDAFNEGFTFAQQDTGFYYFNKKGIRIQGVYSYPEGTNFNGFSNGLAPVEPNLGYTSFIDTTGKLIPGLHFFSSQGNYNMFCEKLAIVCRTVVNGETEIFIVIDKTGKTLLNIPENINLFPFSEGMAHAKMNNKFGYIKRP